MIERDESLSLSQYTLKEMIRQTIFSIAINENNKFFISVTKKEEKALKVLDHDFGEWETVKEPTCKEKGINCDVIYGARNEELFLILKDKLNDYKIKSLDDFIKAYKDVISL